MNKYTFLYISIVKNSSFGNNAMKLRFSCRLKYKIDYDDIVLPNQKGDTL